MEIRNSKFINNTGQGIVLLVNKEADGTATISNVVIDNNEVRGNYAGIIAVNTSNHTITNNTISQSRMKIYSLSLGRTSNITVANNTILDGGIRNMDKNNTILFNNVFPATVYVYGVGQVGEHLRAEVVNDDSLPTNISYQWYADRVAIPNANSANYLITANEVNKTLTVGVRFTNGAGAEETATSLPTRRIRP
ncbi:MAG: hypothetical protein Q4B28_03075 [bacterium]|nr:hypothetical protein [bacterium]